MRKEGYLYVDKTDMVWQLANDLKYNFFSRPRRFGKSLLTSTLKCYFEGKRELFVGLKIMELEKEWIKRPVLSFDFSGLETAEALTNHISSTLSKYEHIYGKIETDKTFVDRLITLMQRAYEQTGQKVAVLVDEYDSPLQHSLFEKEEHKELVRVYRSFFPALKTAGDYLQCLFLTGITKFTQLSLFSTLNNTTAISSWERYATICGFTRQEIIDNFQPELLAMGEKNGWTLEETLSKLKEAYDGYRFSEDADPAKLVYNPYSVINALNGGKISNYWAASGASQLLNDVLRQTTEGNFDIEDCVIDRDDLENSDVDLKRIQLFLYQTGYLTIKDCDEYTYTLGIPNNEVRRALYKIVLPNTLNRPDFDVDTSINRIRKSLRSSDIRTMMENLKQFLAETPYSRDKRNYEYEEYYRMIMRATFTLVGCKVEEEKQVATGRIDLVASLEDKVTLVFELKMNNNGGVEAAKKQLLENDYTSAFAAQKGKVFAIAVAFSNTKRGIDSYEII